MMLLSTAAIGLTSVAMTSASAGEVEKKFAWSGHVNRAIVAADDGNTQAVIHSDPSAISQSRARMKASAKSESMTIGATIELAISAKAQGNAEGSGADSFKIRHNYVYVSNSMGRIRMGQTSHAGESYLGSTLDSVGNAEGTTGGAFDGFKFYNTTTKTNEASGVTVGTATGGAYSTGRLPGISFDTKSFGGFKATVSQTNDSSGAAELLYGGDFNGVKVKAGAMYTTISGSTTEDRQGYGAAIKLKNGLSASANYRVKNLDSAMNSTDRNDPEMYLYRVGYDLPSVNDLGKTAIGVTYRENDDFAATGDKLEITSLLFTQSLDGYGTTVYGGYSHMAYDTTLANFDDIDGVFMGMKVVF